MKNNFLALIIFLIFPLCAKAVRHTGNGGGEAELRTLSFFDSLNIWKKGCNENLDVCGLTTEALNFSFVNLKLGFIENVNFIQSCHGDNLWLSHNSLYFPSQIERQDVSRSDADLVSVLLKGIFSCHNLDFSESSIKGMTVLPIHKDIISGQFAYLKGLNTDVLVSLMTSQNLHQGLVTLLSCNNYRVLEQNKNSLRVTCSENHEVFDVDYLVESNSIKLNAYYVGDF